MHEVVGKGVLPNSFPKQFSFTLKTAHETILKKSSLVLSYAKRGLIKVSSR
jgi:hypothetical protein